MGKERSQITFADGIVRAPAGGLCEEACVELLEHARQVVQIIILQRVRATARERQSE